MVTDPRTALDPSSTDELHQQIQRLELENQRLKKINLALIDRVEAAPDMGGRAYAAFENSALLAEQVRERTAALNQALSELRNSNQALKHAHIEIETLHQRLMDAIESMNDAFVLFDRDRNLVLCNSRYREIWLRYGYPIQQGMTQKTISEYARAGVLDNTATDDELALYQQAFGQVVRLRDGRWLQVNERETATGDQAVLYTDITEFKAIETQRREAALAEKSRILQSTLENLAQGVVLVNDQGYPEIWNERLLQLTGLKAEQLEENTDFIALLKQQVHIDQWPLPENHQTSFKSPAEIRVEHLRQGQGSYELTLPDGRVLELRQRARPEGGRVITFSDITERSLYANALRDSEQKMRLITDALPAMIGYVNADLAFEFTNRAYQEWHGMTRDELQGRPIAEVYSQAQLNRLQNYIASVLAGNTVSFELEEVNNDGEARFVHKSYVPRVDNQQHTTGFFVLTQDITERRLTAEALKNANVLLEQRVAARTAELTTLNAHLLEAKKQAEQANLSKTKFLAAISHDLLQPMNAARLFNSALAEYPLEKAAKQLVRSTQSSLNDVEGLLGALVDISKLDAGVVEPQISVFSVDALLNNLANEYREIAQSVQQRFRARILPCAVRSDSQLLGRILRNFLTNASRYTEAGGQLMLASRRRGDCLRIEIWDTGDGIEQEKLTEIFQEFSRLKRRPSPNDRGLGLGLAIVDKIARVLQHKITVRSVVGVGSVFAVDVPISTEVVKHETPDLFQSSQSDALTGTPVLVLDNDPAICAGMERLLDGWGIDVMTALDFEQSAQLIQDGFEPKMLLVDYHLDNDANGIDVAGKINQLLPTPVPVMLITANYSKELNTQVEAVNYKLLNKPVKPLKLRMMIANLLGQHGKMPIH
ncbi:PAS domain S-box-containing protein [Oceanospirillum multiglobuliferum]|uniref:hybrid sensor histidine kinase/response regulator n=1 Tax=Oceanospirillum multiglobuliferum TaxID=64969 RepID=UPI000999C9D2|nr:NahK/ErcS family hybrid sensor histidine kinase/response regulator [Oceanospirillum multiglobuliferum]SKA23369.1 PAS domain S-box-containing protein [Oceanospirillum multiglobuliferum]